MLVASVPDINNTPNENVVFKKMKKAFMPHTHTKKKKFGKLSSGFYF